jgi:hypothetical protein
MIRERGKITSYLDMTQGALRSLGSCMRCICSDYVDEYRKKEQKRHRESPECDRPPEPSMSFELDGEILK